MRQIQNYLEKLEYYISKKDIAKEAISNESVEWHLHHSLLVIQIVIKSIKNCTPENYKPKFSFVKWAVLLRKEIPRGKGKSPKAVRPETKLPEAALQDLIRNAKEEVNSLSLVNKNKYFSHPIFGDLKLKRAITFLGIHTNHHIKIIEDILK